jgi:HD-GYP domain-containing protein (c-di-GMP phosphodiesterase class II)
MVRDGGERPRRARADVLDRLLAESGRRFDPDIVAVLLEELRREERRRGICEESRARAILDTLSERRATVH